MAWKVFQNNTALTAETLNDVIVEQAVITFADATERNNAIPTPNPGMHCHLLSTKRSYYYDATNGWIELLPGAVSGLTANTPLRCTSTTRPTHVAGRIIFETDTRATMISDGTKWLYMVTSTGTQKKLQSGSQLIIPVANTATSAAVTFAEPFATAPNVVVTAETSVIGTTVMGASVTGITTTGCTLWVYRTNTTQVAVQWIALGN